jgi:hypothetical protein
MVRDEFPDEFHDAIPLENESEVGSNDGEDVPESFQASSDVLDDYSRAAVDEPSQNAIESSLELDFAEPPTSGGTPAGITVGEALSLGMGQVPIQRLPDRAIAALPPPSAQNEPEMDVVNEVALLSRASSQNNAITAETEERFYT